MLNIQCCQNAVIRICHAQYLLGLDLKQLSEAVLDIRRPRSAVYTSLV